MISYNYSFKGRLRYNTRYHNKKPNGKQLKTKALTSITPIEFRDPFDSLSAQINIIIITIII